MTSTTHLALLADLRTELYAWCVGPIGDRERANLMKLARRWPGEALPHVLATLRCARASSRARRDVFDVVLAALDEILPPPTDEVLRERLAEIDVLHARRMDLEARCGGLRSPRSSGATS